MQCLRAILVAILCSSILFCCDSCRRKRTEPAAAPASGSAAPAAGPAMTRGAVLVELPDFIQIEPAEGATVQGETAWVHWDGAPGHGRVLWRKSGDADFAAVNAADGAE